MNILNSINHIKSINIVNGFTPFTFDICGTNFIGSPNNYPIQLNNNTIGTNLTYTNFNNINSITLASIPVTLYIKAKFQNANHKTNATSGNPFDTVFRTYSTGGRGIAIQGTVNPNDVYVGIYDNVGGIKQITVSNLLVNPTDYFHTFLVVTNSNTKVFCYRNTGGLHTESSAFSTSINGNNSGGVYFTRNIIQGYGRDGEGHAFNVIIGLGGWYNRALTTSEMSKVVLQNPN